MDFQHRVVGGDRLECDVRMPADGGEAGVVGLLVRDAAAEFLGFGADLADGWAGAW